MTALRPLFELYPLWRAAFWTSYLAWWGSELWILSRDRRRAAGAEADRGTRRLLIVVIGVSFFVAFWCAYRVNLSRFTAEPALVFGLGMAMVWGGIGFRLWAVLTLGRLFRTTVFLQDDHRLVTSGPYRWLRNPSYTGALITMAGLGVAMGNGGSLLCAVAGPLCAFVWRIRVEERALRDHFGPAYDDYRQRSWALAPLVW